MCQDFDELKGVYIGRVETDRWTALYSLNVFKYNILEVIDFSLHSGISYD